MELSRLIKLQAILKSMQIRYEEVQPGFNRKHNPRYSLPISELLDILALSQVALTDIVANSAETTFGELGMDREFIMNGERCVKLGDSVALVLGKFRRNVVAGQRVAAVLSVWETAKPTTMYGTPNFRKYVEVQDELSEFPETLPKSITDRLKTSPIESVFQQVREIAQHKSAEFQKELVPLVASAFDVPEETLVKNADGSISLPDVQIKVNPTMAEKLRSHPVQIVPWDEVWKAYENAREAYDQQTAEYEMRGEVNPCKPPIKPSKPADDGPYVQFFQWDDVLDDTPLAPTPKATQTVQFYAVETGEFFQYGGDWYRKCNNKTASLLLDATGNRLRNFEYGTLVQVEVKP